MKCPKCGAENPEKFKFCGECGSPLVVKAKSCPQCGTILPKEALFCPECGTKVEVGLYGNDSSLTTFTVNGVSFNMIRVEGGTFLMGALPDDKEAFDYEKPTHSVTLSSFSIGETEVTQALWQAVMGRNPSTFKSDSHRPVEHVSWNDCQKFIRKLNRLTGKNFRLPTEAEWEYAARGGNKSKGYKYSGSNNLGDVAWYDGNSNGQTHPVKQKQANELGIYDMSGNVWEWCQDWYGSYSSSSLIDPKGSSQRSYRMFRGGSGYSNAGCCRSSYRGYFGPDGRYCDLGLRLALSE